MGVNVEADLVTLLYVRSHLRNVCVLCLCTYFEIVCIFVD